MKLITDFKPTAPAAKFDTDAAELIEAYTSNPDIVGAIEVDVLSAADADATEALIAKEVRAFQAATLKLGYSARRVETVIAEDDTTADVLFALKPYVKRAPKETVDEVGPDAVESEAPALKAGK